jgi:hypothetical protein
MIDMKFGSSYRRFFNVEIVFSAISSAKLNPGGKSYNPTLPGAFVVRILLYSNGMLQTCLSRFSRLYQLFGVSYFPTAAKAVI